MSVKSSKNQWRRAVSAKNNASAARAHAFLTLPLRSRRRIFARATPRCALKSSMFLAAHCTRSASLRFHAALAAAQRAASRAHAVSPFFCCSIALLHAPRTRKMTMAAWQM
jgi:hypothetical protein